MPVMKLIVQQELQMYMLINQLQHAQTVEIQRHGQTQIGQFIMDVAIQEEVDVIQVIVEEVKHSRQQQKQQEYEQGIDPITRAMQDFAAGWDNAERRKQQEQCFERF
jgi:hypothetical protein